jgi:hypothetical protein
LLLDNNVFFFGVIRGYTIIFMCALMEKKYTNE